MFVIKSVILCTLCAVTFAQQNLAPIWNITLRNTLNINGIPEDTQVGAVLGQLLAYDPEGGQIIYSGDTDHFEVNPTSGEVTLKVQLDREATDVLPIRFYAEDNANNKVLISYDAIIIDVNDNSPQFEEVPYTALVPENEVIGSTIFTGLRVTDRDRSSNSQLTLECYVPENDGAGIFKEEAQQACLKFSVKEVLVSEGVYTGEISLKQTLNYESKRKYIMTIKAWDAGAKPLDTTVNVVIQVTDVQDSPPQFLNAPLSLDVYENTGKDASVGVIIAQDQDTGVPNDLLIRMLESGENSHNFYLGPVTKDDNSVHRADILSTGNIDSDKFGEIYEFTVEAVELINGKESIVKAQTTVTVTIRDKNDNGPQFDLQEYSVDVKEGITSPNQIPGFFMNVIDNDSGENAMFSLTILDDILWGELSASDVYRPIPALVTGSAKVALAVVTDWAMDYEQTVFRDQTLRIVAMETNTPEHRSSTATVRIHLQDVNDHLPSFSRLRFTEYVRENRAVGEEIVTITATDADSPPLSDLTYSLSGLYSEKFHIDPVTGLITLAEELDYELTERIVLLLTATDGGGGETSVELRIEVLDYNDLGPLFDADLYSSFVGESSVEMSPNITVHAVDRDSDSIVTYRIVSGNTNGAFQLDRYTGAFTLTRIVSYGETPDRQGYFEITVEGNDNGNPAQMSTVPVIITVRDENNNSPVFGSGTYSGTVSEITPPRTSVVQVDATDEDAGDNAVINYVLLSGGKDNFAINPTTGVISVAAGADLDIEKYGDQYNIIVHAVDKGSPQRTASSQVLVRVTDANNQKPSFVQEVYVISVVEDAAIDSTVRTIQATDIDGTSLLEYIILKDTVVIKDKSGNNVSEETYAKYKSSFAVDLRTGAISVASSLNYDEVAVVSFMIEARDVNAETEQQTTTAEVIIGITSVDDGGLEFLPPWSTESPSFTITVPEELPRLTVVMQVVAQDPVTRQTITDYREIAGSDTGDYFTVEQQSGRVMVNKVLDYEALTTKQLTFQIQAFTPAPDERSTVATVIVNVQDINDNSPVFVQNEFSFLISEATTYPAQFGIIQAEDKDSGALGEVRYSLSGQGADMFIINAETGHVQVAPNVTLDRERVAQYNLLVTATDYPQDDPDGQKQISSVPLTITLQDENDNGPKFSTSPYTMYVLEDTDAQTSLGEVYAEDEDDGYNGLITYSIRDGNDDNLFYIETSTGILRSRTNLGDSARDAPYELTVRAQDNGESPKFQDVTVEVFIENVQSQDGKPRFRFPGKDGEIITLPEEAPPGTNVTQIIGIDRNPGDQQELRYGFVVNDALAEDTSKFDIDPVTGLITVRGNLDRETKDFYELLLIVSDGLEEVTRRLYINLTDINDHVPSFGACPGEVLEDPQIGHIFEGQDPGVLVTTVRACDADQPPNNMLYYFIICGNEESAEYGGMSPFRIDALTGEIYSQVSLDHERKEKFMLCVAVSNTPELNVTKMSVEDDDAQERKRRQAEGSDEEQEGTIKYVVYGGDVLNVLVIVDDVDDNGPSFGESKDGQQTNIVAGVLASSRIGTEVVRVFASDPDTGTFTTTSYAIDNIVFYGPNSEFRETPDDVFLVSADTGAVTTNVVSYIAYVDGYFQMTVTASDSENRKSQAQLYIYVVRESQGLRFIFGIPPDETKNVYKTFMSELQFYFSGTDLNVDSLRYHATGIEGEVDLDKTDLCFHMVKDKKVLNTDTGLRMFKAKEDDTELQTLFYRYSVEEVNVCQVKMTTRWWSGHWYYWWILIALAIIIFISVLILMCCICYCWKRFQKNTYYRGKPRPYVVLDPVGIPNGTPASEYEWQTEVVKMD